MPRASTSCPRKTWSTRSHASTPRFPNRYWPTSSLGSTVRIASAESIRKTPKQKHPVNPIPRWDDSQVSRSREDVILAHNWEELRRLMWDYVGIVRSDRRLLRAQRRIQLLQQEINDYYAHHTINRDLLELRNLAQVAELIVRSALSRKESRGLHYNLDHPNQSSNATETILMPTNYFG